MGNNLLQELIIPAQTKIAMIIMDGLGGLPLEPGGKTELETAHTPNLDALAEKSALGLTVPVSPGITPGSGPGHLAIFGYDPLHYEVGRGVLETLGTDFDMGANDVAARGNFCTVDEKGIITDEQTGMPLRFGHGDAVIEMVRRTAYREGFGNELADGSYRLAEKYDHPEMSVTARKQELPGYDPRGSQGMGLLYAMRSAL